MFVIARPEEVLEEHESLWSVIYAALDHALAKTAEFFEREDKDKRINRGLAPNLVRWWAKQYLEVQGQNVVEVDEDGNIALENLANNGLCIHAGRSKIRILKAVDGDLPVPGHSQRKQAFYNQINLPFPTEEEGPVPLNLILLWDVTKSYNLASLSLAYPMSGDTTRASVKAHWHEPIPEKYLGLRSLKVLPSEEEPRDLPLLQDQSEREVKEQTQEIG